ncbi:PREDICTED: uncharacterized protein LOC104704986 [Camelina sativa]|uniref:Mitochondrial import inner membrane translocase subunit TIM50 n=1 Tax=Camelina sativa TaxID=90675 RepID=A0ABM0T158_CAMSA|nr:PREDICTED: uncharacterized protein LOC104704986 [Camelina sativa]
MAEEKNNKKSTTIIASYDGSDEYDDDYSCDQDPEETELSLILDKLSLAPPNKEEKKLLVLSLNGLLLHRVHKQVLHKAPKNRSPDASCGPNLVYKRPFVEEFMKFCLERFQVEIWSSACEKNVDIILNIILKDLEDKLLFVWVRDS